MSAISIKVGLGFVAAVVLLGAAQVQVLNALFMFAAAGIIPGTNISLSPDATLYMVAGWLMLGVVLVCRSYVYRLRHRPELEKLIQDHLLAAHEQPAAESVPRPRLRARVAVFCASVRVRIVAIAKELYVELKSFRRPFLARAGAARREFAVVIVRLHQELPTLATQLFTASEALYRTIRNYLQVCGLWLVQACMSIDRWFFK